MPNFQIHGLDIHGNLQEIVVSAENVSDAHTLARQSGINVLKVANVSVGELAKKNRTPFDLALFTEELIAILSAGLSLIETLETLAERQQATPHTQGILLEIARLMRQGKSFSVALKSFPHIFPELYVASVTASEQTGEIIDALTRYLRYHEQINLIRQKIISASLYPSLLLLVGSSVAIFLLCFLVPRFSQVYEGMNRELPMASRLLMQWGIFVSGHTAIVIMSSLALLISAVITARNANARQAIIRIIKHNSWIKEKLDLLQFSRFSRSLSMLLRGGIPLIKALNMTNGLMSANLQLSMAKAIQEVEQGKTLSDSLEKVEFTNSVALRLLRAGERNGQLADMLERIASFHDKEITVWIDKFTRLFEPILMLLIGVVIGGIVILLYLPIFALTSSIE